ncbi:hypothetical protein CLAIMM_04257 [Cladophialophora immunda]|nr:hypothetical protein CLAIMM_04257 [Cladophialophora immunda]
MAAQMDSLPTFGSPVLRIVCTSDTHNDDCRESVPHGDIFVHAGDMTDNGTLEEFQKAYDWIASLPHPVKIIVAGNHDLGLDQNHTAFSRDVLDLFTSENARAAGIQYLDREVRTVGYCVVPDQKHVPIRVYGNPTQPDFLNMPYAFTYPPFPSPASIEAWNSSPDRGRAVNLWVMHSPPKDRLDAINIPGLSGCAAELGKIAGARPMLCVFGHYHFSWGVERVRWNDENGVAEAELFAMSKERRQASGDRERHEEHTVFDFSGQGVLAPLDEGEETVFVNAAWMTMKKRAVTDRNPPFQILLDFASVARVAYEPRISDAS